MRILAVGDIVGRDGLNKLKLELPKIIENKKIDFVIANGENAADGMGITEKMYKELINSKVNVVTMGNHTWGKKDIFGFIDDKRIIRPANYSNNNPGKGYRIYECKNKKIAVINLIGRVTMSVLSENPFLIAKEIIDKIKNVVDIIVIDFHAEATAEKIALAYYLNGEATVIFGTHTHVQTADEKIMKNGTAYITDIGMTGPIDSVIGMSIEASVKRFETSLPERYKVAEGDTMFNGCIFEIDDKTNKANKIERIQIN
ncbi:MAG: TIGR00282 family metallophosphoesterase [Clostridia bacterium]|nr:TIGR00282 family metallophosphoesterase [Clostridia bacterium]